MLAWHARNIWRRLVNTALAIEYTWCIGATGGVALEDGRPAPGEGTYRAPEDLRAVCLAWEGHLMGLGHQKLGRSIMYKHISIMNYQSYLLTP